MADRGCSRIVDDPETTLISNDALAFDEVYIAIRGKIVKLLDVFAWSGPVNLQFVYVGGGADA